jgi:hypothetical protein
LEILIWKSKETILKEENLLEQDITVKIQAQNGKPDIGLVINGDQELR